MHTNPSIFPEPFKYDPERWIRAAEQEVPLGGYLVNFNKGTRGCLGIK
jgi:cytochrome P450